MFTMKRTYTLLAFLALPLLVAAQDSPLEELFGQYLDKPGIEAKEILPGKTSFTWEKDLEGSALREAMAQVDNIRILMVKEEAKTSPGDMMKKVEKAVSRADYTLVAEARSGDMEACLYALRDDTGKTREISMVARGKEQLMLVSVSGRLDFSRMINPEVIHELVELGGIIKQEKHCSGEHDK
jgi:hypothetical protein